MIPGTRNGKKNGKKKIVKVKINLSWKNLFLYGFLFLVTLFLLVGFNSSFEPHKTVPISQIISDVKAGKVSQIVVTDTKLTVTEKDKTLESTKEAGANVYSLFRDAGVPLNKT